ncbi:MAG TPA: DNRLRE domain-containing protein, partial [Chloroflexi bacterium]|nr:DNRLRE domain-containing protein [Chloroflexota bacterium]
WAHPIRLDQHELWDYAPRVMQAADGRLWVVWYSYRSGNWDIWYSTSADDGATWTDATQLTTHTDWDYNPDLVQLHDGTIWVVWHSRRSGNMDIWSRRTTDGGSTWSDDTRLTTDPESDSRAAIVQSSDRTLWLFWHSTRSGESDLYYRLSTDGGNTWSADVRYTRFAGPDQDVSAVALSGGRVALFWHSDRAVSEDIWMAVPGYDEDTGPPPHYEDSYYEPRWVTHEDVIQMRVEATDDDAVASVSLVWTLNGAPQTELGLYDDGQHGDEEAGDGIYGGSLGPFPESSVIGYRFRIRDTAGNEILAPLVEGVIRVQGPFARTEDVLLVLDQGPQSTAWFEPYFTRALDDAGYGYDLWLCDQRGDVPDDILREYVGPAGVVIWAVPDAGYLGSTETQRNLERFLDEGGNLFIVGQDAGFNLRDSALLHDYLSARLAQDDVGLYALQGVTGDILDGLYLALSPVYADPYDGAENQSWPSELEALPPAVVIARYDHLAGALPRELVRSADDGHPVKTMGEDLAQGAGALRIDTGDYRAVIMGFGLEALQSAGVRAQVMGPVISWLRGQQGAPTPTAVPPTTPTITPIYSPTPTATATPKYTPTNTPQAAPPATATPTPHVADVVLQQGLGGYTGVVDSYLDKLDTDANFSTSPRMQVMADGMAVSLIRFDLSMLPANARIDDAQLRLYVLEREGQSLMVASAYGVRRAWQSDQATWHLAGTGDPWGEPGGNSIVVDREGMVSHNTMLVQAERWYSFDLTDLVARWYRQPETNHGVLLRSDSKQFSRAWLASSQHPEGTLRPQLAIRYALLPEDDPPEDDPPDGSFGYMPLILRFMGE